MRDLEMEREFGDVYEAGRLLVLVCQTPEGEEEFRKRFGLSPSDNKYGSDGLTQYFHYNKFTMDVFDTSF